MIKEVVRNGVTSTSTHPLYQQSMANPTKKHISFAQNSCHPLNNSISNLKNLNNSMTTIDLCQKRWFLIVLICLAAIVVFNLSTTFWIINVLKLNDNGIGLGSIILTKKGIDIRSDITFDGSLNTKLIKTLNTKESFNFNLDEPDKIILKNSEFFENSLSLGNGKLEVQSNSFQIRSTNPLNADNMDDILFNVEPNEITTYTKNFLLPTLGGHKIVNSLETHSIRGNLYHDLRLESRTQRVLINGDKDIHLESKGGDILVQSYESTIFSSVDSIVFDSKRVDFKHLPKIDKFIDESIGEKSYQLCLCESGLLFAVKPDGVCEADPDWCLSTADV